MGWLDDYMDNLGCFGIIVGGGVVLLFAALFAVIELVGAAHDKASWPAPIAEYEQLRADAARIDLTASPHVMGQVAEFNRKLAAAQAANSLWWRDPFIADEWMGVKPIPVPEKK